MASLHRRSELGVALRQFGRDLSSDELASVFERARKGGDDKGQPPGQLNPASFARVILELRGDAGLGRGLGDIGQKRGLIGLR